jgi:hypothetical protein
MNKKVKVEFNSLKTNLTADTKLLFERVYEKEPVSLVQFVCDEYAESILSKHKGEDLCLWFVESKINK